MLIALGSMLGPDVALSFASDIARKSEFDGSESIAKKLDQVAQSKLGLKPEGDPSQGQDPQAVDALNKAQEATTALQEQMQALQQALQQSQQNAMQLQTALDAQKAMAQATVTQALIAKEGKIEVANIQKDTKLTEQQMKIQADAQAESNAAIIDLQKHREKIAADAGINQ